MQPTWNSLVFAWKTTWAQPELQQRTALEFDGRRISYAELSRRVGVFASGLRQSGVGRGDLIAVDLDRSVEAVVAVLACIGAGACPCPLEPRLSIEQTNSRLESVGIDWLLCSAGRRKELQDLPLAANRILLVEEVRGAAQEYWDEAAGPQDRALLLFTSGSTGRPKGVLLTHGNIINNATGVIAHTGLSADDRLLHVMPLHHTNALNNQLFAPFLCGATVIFAGRFKAEEMPKLMHDHRPTIITGVPTIYARLLSQTFSEQSLSGLRLARCGSAPITVDLHEQIEAKLGCALIVSYGLSEATCTSTLNPPSRRKIGTVGTVLAGQQVTLLGPDGQHVAPGQEGEVCIGGASVMACYVGAEPGTMDRTIHNGWLRTGDLGRFDSEGYLAITGRIKEVIIRGGENLSPVLIENAIASHPGVAACCVVGKADADLGEVPVAFVIRSAGSQPMPEEIIARVAQRLSRIYQPHEVHFVESLPENSVGKIDRKAVAAQLG
jgi:malonyl-CoA/methylmalonyl-CoA synthetase